MFEFFAFLLIMAIGSNILGLAVTLVTFILFLKRRIRSDKALAYCCFLFAGTAVAKTQWVIVSEQGGEAVRWSIGTNVVLVGTLSVIALVASRLILKQEKPLIAVFVLTVGLAILQFSDVPYQLLNWYARFYALTCVVIPLFVLAKSWSGSDSAAE